MFDTILIPIDGSEPASQAVTLGLDVAAAYDASVELLHVVSDGEEDELVAGKRYLDETAEAADDSGLTVTTQVVVGKPGKAIAARVEETDPGLVVMGRNGRTGITQQLLGSTSDRVLRRVDVPVLTVTDTERATDGIEDVLLTTDGSTVAKRAVPHGADLAGQFAATLHLLSVVDVQAEAGPFDAGGVGREYIERLEAAARDDIDQFTAGTDLSEVEVTEAVVRGRPTEEIRAYADEHDIDLLVMASHGETNLLNQHLGSTTNRVLNSVQRPVLVVPARD